MRSPVAVRDVTLTTIKPSEKTDHVKTIQPNYQDLLTGDVYMPALFAYRLRNSDDEYQNFAAQLKSSLAKVLVPFFPYAGRWVSDGRLWTVDGRRGFLLDCNDEGVPFIEAYVDRDIDSVVRAGGGFEAVPELNGHEVLGMDSSVLKQKMRPGGLPPIFFQLTRFKCGGVVLAASFSHIHCDGNAFFEFLQSWAEVATIGECTIVPRVDRELATTFESLIPRLNEDEFPVLREMLRMNAPCGKIMWESSAMRVYEVNAAAIKKLKKNARLSANSGTQFVSTNDCIAAAMWKLLSSLPASLTAEKPTAVLHVAEGRNRYCDPPMPHLIGNVFTPTLCPMPPSSELVKEPLHSLAEKIRTNLAQTDWSNMFSLESLTSMLHGFTGDYIKLWMNTSWYKFGVYELDFGLGGRPYFATALNGSYDYGLLGVSFVLPPVPAHSSSAATVSLSSTPEALDFMESLPEFWDFFLPWESQHSRDMTEPQEISGKVDASVLALDTLVSA